MQQQQARKNRTAEPCHHKAHHKFLVCVTFGLNPLTMLATTRLTLLTGQFGQMTGPHRDRGRNRQAVLDRLNPADPAHALEIVSLDKNHAMGNVPADEEARRKWNGTWESLKEAMRKKLEKDMTTKVGRDFKFDEIAQVSLY